MELNVTISGLVLLVIAIASIAGGLVLYRGSRRVGWRAVGVSAVALGGGVLLVFALTLPVRTDDEAPKPVIGQASIPAQSTQPPTTQQEPSESESTGMTVLRPNRVDDPPAPILTHGSPPPPAPNGSPLHGDPGPSLKFGDVNYVHSGSAELPPGEGTVFVIDGIEISFDVLEMVGTTYEGRTAGIHEGLVVYRLKDDGTNDVYTFRPGEEHVNPENGQVFKGKDVWTRWTTG